jgi:hypothetical protein
VPNTPWAASARDSAPHALVHEDGGLELLHRHGQAVDVATLLLVEAAQVELIGLGAGGEDVDFRQCRSTIL